MTQSRRQFLAASAAVAMQPRRPNIVFILSDDHRWDMMGCAGHAWLKTPNLDRLASGGMRFKEAFVTTSLCSPSRASILTGLYAHAHGVVDNFQKLPAQCATFPKLLQRGGYRTAFIGKWHMGDPVLEQNEADNSDAPQPGFDHWVSFKGQGSYVSPMLNVNGIRGKRPGYTTDVLTEEAVGWMRAQKEKPFCLFLSHKAVHADFRPAPRHAGMYATEKVPIPASSGGDPGQPEWLARKRNASRHGLKNLYEGTLTLEDLYRGYARTLMSLDDSVGTVVDQLRSMGTLENTLVVYMGDNGYLLGEHGLVDKRVMYEPSIRVPLIAQWPAGFRGGRTTDSMALNLDIAPTVLDAAGIVPPPSMHGRSLLPVLQGRSAAWRQQFLYEYFWDYEALHTPGVLGLRTDQMSLMVYQGIWDVNELYDLKADPDQRNNLLAGVRVTTKGGGWFRQIPAGDLAQTVRDLRGRMVNILRETGAPELTRGLIG